MSDPDSFVTPMSRHNSPNVTINKIAHVFLLKSHLEMHACFISVTSHY